MLSWLPVSTVVDGQGLNLTVVSYSNDLGYGFLACRELVQDVAKLGDYCEEALEELKEKAALKDAS